MRFLATIDSRQIAIHDVDLTAGRARVDGRPVLFDFQPLRPGVYSLILDHRVYTVQVAAGAIGDEVTIGAYHSTVLVEDERAALLRRLSRPEDDRGPLSIDSPMPGLVVRLFVEADQQVRKGQPLAIIEAMKMENEIKSPIDGVVTSVFARERDIVEKDGHLMQLVRAPADTK